MLKTLPPSVFFGKKNARGHAKIETELAASTANAAKVTSCKTNIQDVGLKKISTGERQLRSTSKQTAKTTIIPANSAKTTCKPAITSPPDLPGNSVRNLRARKNERLKENLQQCSNVSVRMCQAQDLSRRNANVKSVDTQPKEKNPVYKQAKLELSAVGVSDKDEYEFQVETPEGILKKVKKRQARLKTTKQTLWGLKVRPETKRKLKPTVKVIVQEPENVKAVKKIQPTIGSKDLKQNPFIKKAVAPLQVRTGNTLCPVETSGILTVSENCGDILLRHYDGKKNMDKSTSGINSKCAQRKTHQTVEEVKENIPVIKKKTPDSSGSKTIETPFKERSLVAHSNSTPVRSITSPVMNNMSVILSPIHGVGQANQIVKSTPRGNSIHASTPVQFNVHTKISGNSKCLKEISSGNSQSQTQNSFPIPIFPQSTVQSNQTETPPKEYQSTQQNLSDSTSNFDGILPTSPLENDAPNDKRNPAMASNSEKPERFQAPSTWRLGSTVRYDFNFNPNIDNCFGFDDDGSELVNVIESNQLLVPVRVCNRNGRQAENNCDNQFHLKTHDKSLMKPCPQPEAKQVQKRLCISTQTKISSQLTKKPVNKKTATKPSKQTGQEEPPRSESQVTSVPPEQDINDLLSSSLSKLRKKKKEAEGLFFGNITPEDHLVATKSLQQITMESEETMTTSKHLPTLFDDLEKDDLYKSPFSEPPRRSYACVRRPKRMAVEEEDEEEEEDKEANKEKQTRTKRNKTVYKRKKMVQTTLLDQWAKELSSHFAEVDDTDLVTE